MRCPPTRAASFHAATCTFIRMRPYLRARWSDHSPKPENAVGSAPSRLRRSRGDPRTTFPAPSEGRFSPLPMASPLRVSIGWRSGDVMNVGTFALLVLVAFAVGYAAGRADRIDLGPLRRVGSHPAFGRRGPRGVASKPPAERNPRERD